MPVDGSILGFSSRWYRLVVQRSTQYALTDQISILIPEAPIFVATKWDAFLDRGHDDYLGSHDLEDIISVVAGRSELAAELAATDEAVRTWLAERAADFLAHELADYAIQGALPDASTIPALLDEVRALFEAMRVTE